MKEHFSMRVYAIFIILAYIFSVAIRYIWVDWASGFPEFYWNGELMINTNDGYLWAEGARDILAGFHQANDLSPVNEPISMLTAFLAKVLPFKFETIILWMPAFFGSLLVVPVMLIAKTLKQDLVGIIAGLGVGIVWSYYNRTMTGYYDTDMLTIVFPTFILWFIILSIKEQKNRYILLTALTMLLCQWWYPSARALDMAFGAIVLLYTVIFDRKNLFNYKILIFISIIATPISISIQLILLIGLFLYFHFYKKENDKYILYLLGASILFFMIFGGLGSIWEQVKGYILREAVDDASNSISLHYYAIAKTVREAGHIPFEIFADRISGAIPLFIISTAGYILFALKERLMLLALPMLGLGFIAMQGGLRFTVYAVPIEALGFGYIVVWFANKVSEYIKGKRASTAVRHSIITLSVIGFLTPNILHIISYKVPTVFKKSEVEVLDRLKNIAQREDYVLTWWDYGYPIRYYSDVKTLIDGGKHLGMVNYPVSYALVHPQNESAIMARLDTEYTEKEFKKPKSEQTQDYIALMMRDYNFSDPNDFLVAIESGDIKPPKKSRDIYYYLPYRMLNIFPTINLFSNLDLKTGKSYKNPFFASSGYMVKGDKIYLNRSVYIDVESGNIHFRDKIYPINTIALSYVGKDGKVHSTINRLHSDGDFYIVVMKSYGRVLILDRKYFDSTYIQLFALGRYNKSLFEPVIITPMAMIYKLKI